MKLKQLLLPLIAVFLFISCAKTGDQPLMLIDNIAVPPEAKTGTIDGGYEVALDNATNAILSDVKRRTGRVEEKIFFLPADADAGKIFAFFEEKFTGGEFVKDPDVPLQGKDYQLKHWKSGRQVIAVAVIEAGRNAEGRAIKFLAVFLGTKTVI